MTSRTRHLRMFIGAALAITSLFTTVPALAQTPLANGGLEAGKRHWYIAVVHEGTTVKGKPADMSGMQFGVIFPNRVGVSLEGYNLLNKIEPRFAGPEGADQTYFQYGGVAVDYYVPVGNRISIVPRLLVGGGEAHWRNDIWDGLTNDFQKDEEHTTSLMVQPGVGADFAINSWMHLTAGISYRYMGGGESRVLRQSDMRGFGGQVGVRFGHF